MKKVAITNTTGGRNRGCEALVTTIIQQLRAKIERLEIELHTRDVAFDKDFYGDQVNRYFEDRASRHDRLSPDKLRNRFNLMRKLQKLPRHGKVPADWRSLLNVDMIVSTGGDIFTSDYGDAARHARVLQTGTPVALLAHTIGPFNAEAEDVFRRSLRNIALCTVRESESYDYIRSTFPDLPVEQTADVAFLLPVTPPEEAKRLLRDEHHFDSEGKRLVGFSISSGILSFRRDVNADSYVKEIAAFIDSLNDQGFSVVLIPHVQERVKRNNDIYASREVLRHLKQPENNLLLSLPILSASDYKGIIGLCEALIGARTHATIASMSQGIPTVSIAYSRKAWGIMRDYYGDALGKDLTIEVAELDRERMAASLNAALKNGRTENIAAEMKERAMINFDRLAGLIKTR